MRPMTMIEYNQNKEEVREDLLRWKRKLQEQAIYATQKVQEIDVALKELDRKE